MPPLPAKKRKTGIVGFGSTSSGAKKVIGLDKKPAKITKKTKKTDTKKTGVHTFGEMIKEGQRKEAGSKAKQDGGDKTDADDADYKPDPDDAMEEGDAVVKRTVQPTRANAKKFKGQGRTIGSEDTRDGDSGKDGDGAAGQ
ncbi:hypothetical protein B0A54_13770 [Friedmanniomyces endolithicus]|uniref:Uncharacterized protein n=1 Tax=Friedmanniomyces endolithicus TaxID=329885 RepID=A0A4U0UIP0_9PEZI|nr:hypothetical protein LTS09_017357 [Friedmanniomyces endolithicus]TKA34626.1 hypothetical protein B0A54_13770 [Friedmanniomyces endolithicus]